MQDSFLQQHTLPLPSPTSHVHTPHAPQDLGKTYKPTRNKNKIPKTTLPKSAMCLLSEFKNSDPPTKNVTLNGITISLYTNSTKTPATPWPKGVPQSTKTVQSKSRDSKSVAAFTAFTFLEGIDAEEVYHFIRYVALFGAFSIANVVSNSSKPIVHPLLASLAAPLTRSSQKLGHLKLRLRFFLLKQRKR